MNYEVSKDTVSVRRSVYEGCQEQPLDLDFSLPDYCPDIQKILKCKVEPHILSRNVSGDRLNIEGITKIKLIYLDSEKMQIQICENSSPFSSSINLKSSPENAFAITSARLEYINCRAVSPRKVDLHGAFSICAKVMDKEIRTVPCCISGKDIQQQIQSINAKNLIGIGQQHFSVNEELEIPKKIENLIRTDVDFTIDDHKIMPNKVVIKGEALVKILFVSDLETGIPETMEYSIPVSQIVDVPGITEESHCGVMPEVLNFDTEVKENENENEESRLLLVDIKIAATVLAYEQKELGIVSNIYSTNYDLETENESFNMKNFNSVIKDSFSHKTSVDLEDLTASRIIDVWSDVISAKCEHKDNKLNLNSKMNLCILALDQENTPFYIERATEIQRELPTNGNSENMTAELFLTPIQLGHSLSGNNIIEVKVNFKLHAIIYKEEKHNLITSATADETVIPENKDTSAALTIYYAEKGENIWDIAKKYYTSVNAIKQENSLEGDVAERSGMILIPAVKN